MIYGEELRQSIISTMEHLKASKADRDERIANGSTDIDDCFMSIKVDDEAMRECNAQLEILDGDGMMDYNIIVDEDGNEVNVRWVHTRYGMRCVGRGIFANSYEALCRKTGWQEKATRVPAWTKYVCNGSGMAGVYSGSYQVVRWHTNMKTGEYVGYPE